MKKIVVVFSLFFLPALQPLALAEGKIAFGAQGGLSFSDFKVKNSSVAQNKKYKNGYLGGVFVEFGLGTITLRPEINYVTKVIEYSNVAKVTNRYIEVPLLLKINPFGEVFLSPFLLGGVSYSNFRSSKVETLGTTTVFRNTSDEWDMAGVAGAGIEFNVAENIALNAQGRYNFGLRDIDSSSAEVRSRGFYALAGVSLQN
jgi:opacity protein-like surface antigen